VIEMHEHKGDFKEWRSLDSFSDCSGQFAVQACALQAGRSLSLDPR